MSATAIVIASGLLGAVLGSFATVAVWRWPRDTAVNDPPRSQCPRCGVALRWRDNVPIMAWLVRRGRCRACGEPYGVRYLAVELATMLAFVAVAAAHPTSWLLPALLVTAWTLVVAAAIDLEHSIIPNRLSLRAPGVVAPLVAGAAWILGDGQMLLRSIVAAVAIPAVMLVLSEAFRLLRGQVGIGMGDVKLAVTIGLSVGALGWWHVVVFAYGSILSAVAVALVLMVAGKAVLATRIPFGPYLALGALGAIVAGDALRDALGWLVVTS